MILTTTPTLEGHPIREYRGVVTGETIIGANAIKDFMAGMRDFFGGRSKSYESVLREAKDTAMREMAERAQQKGCAQADNPVAGADASTACATGAAVGAARLRKPLPRKGA